MDNRDLRFIKFLLALIIIGVIYVLYDLSNNNREIETWKVDWGVDETPTVEPSPIEGMGISISRAKPTDWNSPTPTFTITPEPTATPTPTFVVISTPTPKPTNTPKPTKTPKPTPRPTVKPTQSVYPCEMTVPRGGHDWKPWARHTKITLKSSPQYKLQKKAKTDSNGLRYCIDPNGEKRYCVALNTYWCGGDPEDIGRCFDVVMANGSTIKCCLGDVKKDKNSWKGQCKFGSRGELLEFQAEEKKLSKKINGDVSALGGAFEGEAVKIIAYDFFIEGLGK